MSIFKRVIHPPIKDLGSRPLPSGSAVQIFEDEDQFTFIFDYREGFGVRLKGDLIYASFTLFRRISIEKYIEYVLWLLTDDQIREMLNLKYGNNADMRFSAALFTADDYRGCTLLPTDTIESAMERFNSVWYKQPIVPGQSGKIAHHREE